MSQRYVERVLGRLATDPALRRRFAGDAADALRGLMAEGCDLTPVEIDALSSLDSRALDAFAAALDARLRRLDA